MSCVRVSKFGRSVTPLQQLLLTALFATFFSLTSHQVHGFGTAIAAVDINNRRRIRNQNILFARGGKSGTKKEKSKRWHHFCEPLGIPKLRGAGKDDGRDFANRNRSEEYSGWKNEFKGWFCETN
mmetsp:Transcript_8558/g.12652  ORF Transcript_8558/g.12652 Transcript_8558/m.12652 type:complete len:125 (+) Transcript_8558:155-529(+)